MGAGLLLVPVLVHYPSLGLILVALGIFVGTDLSVNRGKGPVGTFLCLGLTLITAAGVMDFYAALTVAKSLMKGIALAVLAQQVAYFFFPEDPVTGPAPAKPATPAKVSSNWIATRTTLIVFPAYLLGLINPTMYLPIIMKSLSLGQQSSVLNARNAGKELLDSTFMGGAFSMLFWFALKIQPNLLMFFLWMLVFAGFLAAKIYRIFPTDFPPSFWMNVAVTMIILLGPAVADSASGKDVYKAFAVRMALFVAVTVYAWAAVMVLENLRLWRLGRRSVPETVTEVS